jgi:lysyl endopeptidase
MNSVDGVTLRFRGTPDAAVSEVTEKELRSGVLNWSPIVTGDTMTIEVELASHRASDAFTMRIPQVSHLDVHPDPRSVSETSTSVSAPCEHNIACRASSSALMTTSKAVALIFYTEAGHTHACSGTLLNNSNTPKKALVFTAAHCIDSEAIANTVQTYWSYEYTTCTGSTLSSSYSLLIGGANLRYSDSTKDVALIELRRAPPATSMYAGWSTMVPALASQVEGIHHPHYDVKKSSQGALDYNSGQYGVTWSYGITEGGSSGSGLFIYNAGGYYQLVGALQAGASSCSNPKGHDMYSSLSDAWAGLRPFLQP